jgi:antitoxin VapB
MSKVKAKIFTHGGSQAVRLPKEFRFDGKEVLIHREGCAVVLEPLETDWDAVWDRIDRIRGDSRLVAPPDPPAEAPPRLR